jgi:hypothetical protein
VISEDRDMDLVLPTRIKNCRPRRDLVRMVVDVDRDELRRVHPGKRCHVKS